MLRTEDRSPPRNPGSRTTLFLACANLLAGCSALRPGDRPQPAERRADAPLAERAVDPVPMSLPPPPAEPIYRNPKIGVVYLRAHQDEQGRLLGPQVMYQVTEPGGWNVDAAGREVPALPASNAEEPETSPQPLSTNAPDCSTKLRAAGPVM